MRIIETEAYKFGELTPKAQEKAIDAYRDINVDYFWWDSVYENVEVAASILGIELKQKPVKLMNGETRYDPAIYFTGFASQGDGAETDRGFQDLYPVTEPYWI